MSDLNAPILTSGQSPLTYPLSILHVDDDEDTRIIVELSLALDNQIVVRSACHARAALEILWRSNDIDLLLTDYQMPDMSGPELFDAARLITGYEALPIIFLTARADAGVLSELTRLGTAGVLLKPFDPMGLAHEIRMLSGKPIAI